VQAGFALDPATIETHCNSRLARYKVPQFFRVVESLPRTPSGKIQKHLLRAQWNATTGEQANRDR